MHSGSETSDRCPLAGEWMRCREAELDPLRAHGEPLGKGSTLADLLQRYGEQMKKVGKRRALLLAVRSLEHRRPTARVMAEDPDGTHIPDPRVFPYHPKSVGANVTHARRRRVRRHCVSTNSNTKPPRVCSNAVTASRKSPNSSCMSPGRPWSGTPISGLSTCRSDPPGIPHRSLLQAFRLEKPKRLRFLIPWLPS